MQIKLNPGNATGLSITAGSLQQKVHFKKQKWHYKTILMPECHYVVGCLVLNWNGEVEELEKRKNAIEDFWT